MARRRRHRTKINLIAALLAALLIAFCVLSTLNEKYDMDLGIPALPAMGLLTDFLEELDPGSSTGRPGGAVGVTGEVVDAPLSVHFLDIGQGKAILIRGPGKNVLIDAGENGKGEEVLQYLAGQGITRLDYVVGTHPHSDHIGGMDSVIDSIDVGAVILPEIPDAIVPTSRTYTDLLLSIANKGLKITPSRPGDVYDLGGGASLTILGPVAEYGDLNNMSVVCRVDYREVRFLFTGDMEAPGERDLLEEFGSRELSAQVLDIGHHGSSSSTTEAFLDTVRPQIGVISCGVDNSYGHPHREVVERMAAYGVELYRTDLQGAVVVATDGAELSVSTG